MAAALAVVASLLVPGVAGADLLPTPGLISTGNVLPGLVKAVDQGPAPATAPMHVVVTLARPDVAGEEAVSPVGALRAREHFPGL